MASPTPPPETFSPLLEPDAGQRALSRGIDSGLDKPAATACTECRRKHVRCDATTPICLRCSSSGSQCCYLPSRRGLKRRHTSLDDQHAPPPPISRTPAVISSSVGSSFGPSVESTRFMVALSPPVPISEDGRHDTLVRQNPSHVASKRQDMPERTVDLDAVTTGHDDDALINLFYANFHAAHPFLVPRSSFVAANYPHYLRQVVRFIGSHYSGTTSSQTLREPTMTAVTEAGQREQQQGHLHLVQARLLLSIALHARNEIKESVSMLARAVSLALEIGLNRREFCEAYGSSPTSILAESVRRTWWELYVTDGFVAALQRKTSFLCHEAEADMLLPCEENVYLEERAVDEPPRTMAEFEARIFADEETPSFSSFCYRIEAVHNLARVLAISGNTHEMVEEKVQAIDSTLAAWPHHLPPEKISSVDSTGELDEMLFQAHMLIQYTIIYLHFPRSHLVATVPATSDIIRQRHLVPFSTRTMHGVKAIEASKQLGNLAALHAAVTKHTPFFVFAIVFGAIVQLSAVVSQQQQQQRRESKRDHYRDRISLTTGVLKTLGPIWAFSMVVARKLRRIAAEVFQVSGGGGVISQTTHPTQSTFLLPTTADMDWMDLLQTHWVTEFEAGIPSGANGDHFLAS